MDFLYSLFFGLGVAGFAYSRLGRRVGYGNTGNVWTIVGIAFVLAVLVCFIFLKFILSI